MRNFREVEGDWIPFFLTFQLFVEVFSFFLLAFFFMGAYNPGSVGSLLCAVFSILHRFDFFGL